MVCPMCISAAIVANAPSIAAAAAAAAGAAKVASDAAAAARQAPLRVQAKPQKAKLPRLALQALKAEARRPLSGGGKAE